MVENIGKTPTGCSIRWRHAHYPLGYLWDSQRLLNRFYKIIASSGNSIPPGAIEVCFCQRMLTRKVLICDILLQYNVYSA